MKRHGFTLMELMIVCAIMVLMASLAVMSMQSMQPSFKLNGAVDSVRAAWAIARARATDEDRPYRFCFEPNGRHFRVAPDDEADNGEGGTVDALPAGVRFVVNGDPGAAPPGDAVADSKAGPSGQWETACVLLPDGTSRQDVRIVFHVKGSSPTQLELRGLTGVSYVTRLK